MTEEATATISFEEYEKLQLDFIESQKELKEITELFEQYREETESMEEVQSRQVEMVEQQLEKATLEKEYLMLTLKKELQEIQIETQKLLLEKDEEVQKLRLDVKLKTLAITKFMSDYSDNKEKNAINDENEPKNDQDKDQTIVKLKKEIAVKDFLINDLANDIKKNREVIEEQKALFKKFSSEILEKTKERDDALKSLKDQQIDELKRVVDEKEELIRQLEKENDPGVSQEENDLMREMILQQQEKLMSLTKNFEGDESEKLFLGQIQLRDSKIKLLEAQLKQFIITEELAKTTDETTHTEQVAKTEEITQTEEKTESPQTEETLLKQEGENKSE